VHLVQLLLPIQSDPRRASSRVSYEHLVARLSDRFGGVTAYLRAPATGLWEAPTGETVRDEVVVYEVMVYELDLEWWAGLRRQLEVEFAQREVVVRAFEIRRL
jgi:hypothetical protein